MRLSKPNGLASHEFQPIPTPWNEGHEFLIRSTRPVTHVQSLTLTHQRDSRTFLNDEEVLLKLLSFSR